MDNVDTAPMPEMSEDDLRPARSEARLSPAEWVKANLFNNVMNSIITVVMSVLILAVAWLSLSWVIDEDWQIVRSNLRLFMVGQFPKDELWRLWASGFVVLGALGFMSGASARSAMEAEHLKGLPAEKEPWSSLIRRFWAIIAVTIFFASFARTWSPVIGLVAGYAAFVVGRTVGWSGPLWLRIRAVFLTAALFLVSMMLLAGTSTLGGRAAGLLVFLWVWWELSAREIDTERSGYLGRLVFGAIVGLIPFVLITTSRSDGFAWKFWNDPAEWSGTKTILGLLAIVVTATLVARLLPADRLSVGASRTLMQGFAGLVAATVIFFLIVLVRSDGFAWGFWNNSDEWGGLSGFGWEDWGGLHVTLFVTVIGIGLGMPFGVLLALGRKSELPVVRGASVMFIEFVRGVPLISLLLFSNLMLPLFFPVGREPLAGLTLAMIVIMGFSAAYIAEIVRGGLQAVPKGQTEAAQASGLSPSAVQRLVVLPQALRAVIPAMVGQFIALFKDTSLLAIIAIPDFFQISSIANAQTDFVGKKLAAVTYVFVALGYWAFAYTMSKESRRLETKLGVGTR